VKPEGGTIHKPKEDLQRLPHILASPVVVIQVTHSFVSEQVSALKSHILCRSEGRDTQKPVSVLPILVAHQLVVTGQSLRSAKVPASVLTQYLSGAASPGNFGGVGTPESLVIQEKFSGSFKKTG
jgi:hypothetical protein